MVNEVNQLPLRVAAPAMWSADSVVIRDGALFSFGWCAHPDARVVRSWVEVGGRVSEGIETVERYAVQYGNDRQDVSDYFPSLPRACGYFVFFATRQIDGQSEGVHTATISFEFDDGQVSNYALPLTADAAPAVDASSAGQFTKTASMGFRRAAAMLMRGEVSHVVAALRRRAFAGSRSIQVAPPFADAITRLRVNSAMLIDHAMGGGANKFSAVLIEQHLSTGRDVLVWTFVPSSLQLVVRITHATDRAESTHSVTWDAFAQILATKKVSDLIFNNAVSFTQPHRIPELLSACKSLCDARITVYVHDFHAVCPSQFLIDAEGQFCGVPSIERCRQCLPKHKDGFASLFVSRDIDRWRALWGQALSQADEVVCFSASSVSLLRRAFPLMDANAIRVVPHQVIAPPGHYQAPRASPKLKVGVVGHISVHKGSQVVADLVSAAIKVGAALEVVVIGTLSGAQGDVQCEQTGSYEQAQLAQLLTAHGVDLALMPSVCPETFSYVTHELMALSVPVVCFDLGAQAEAVSQYRLGKVVALSDGRSLLDELLSFHGGLQLIKS